MADLSTERLKELLASPEVKDGGHPEGPSEKCANCTLAELGVDLAQALLEARERADKLYEDAMIAHRWFSREFGEEFNGRDFAVKVPMAEARLATARQELREAVEALGKIREATVLVHSEPVGMLYTVRDIADEALKDFDAKEGK